MDESSAAVSLVFGKLQEIGVERQQMLKQKFAF
jgi:hypothetical protein